MSLCYVSVDCAYIYSMDIVYSMEGGRERERERELELELENFILQGL